MNEYQRFLDLVGGDPLLIGVVISHNAGGTSTVQLLDGGILTVRGQDVAVNAQAFVRGGVVEGPAPALTLVLVDV